MTDDKKNNSDQNQYQDILNQYADQTNSIPEETDDQPKSEDQKSLKDINSLQIEAPDPVLGLPETDQENQLTETPTIPEPQPEPMSEIKEDISPDINEVKSQVDEILNYPTRSDSTDELTPPTETSPSSNLPKILFFISLFIFIGIIIALGYALTSGSKSKDTSSNISPTASPTNSEIACSINGLSLSIGDSFKAADGCNTCSCTAPDVIACTEMACDITPTKTATKSATITPTKSATVSSIKTSIKLATPTIKK